MKNEEGLIIKERAEDKWSVLTAIVPITVIAVSIIGAWYLSGYRIEANENKLNALEERTNENCLKINTLETKVDYIVDGINRIQKRLER